MVVGWDTCVNIYGRCVGIRVVNLNTYMRFYVSCVVILVAGSYALCIWIRVVCWDTCVYIYVSYAGIMSVSWYTAVSIYISLIVTHVVSWYNVADYCYVTCWYTGCGFEVMTVGIYVSCVGLCIQIFMYRVLGYMCEYLCIMCWDTYDWHCCIVCLYILYFYIMCCNTSDAYLCIVCLNTGVWLIYEWYILLHRALV